MAKYYQKIVKQLENITRIMMAKLYENCMWIDSETKVSTDLIILPES